MLKTLAIEQRLRVNVSFLNITTDDFLKGT